MEFWAKKLVVNIKALKITRIKFFFCIFHSPNFGRFCRNFESNLKFSCLVGTSATTGAENQVIWNGVHHKTNLHGGPTK